MGKVIGIIAIKGGVGKTTLASSLDEKSNTFSSDINRLLSKFPNLKFLFIFDEFDNIIDKNVRKLFADLIKTFSDGSLQWSKAFGGSNSDYGSSVKETKDGGFIIIGNTQSFGAGNDDVFLIKTASDGNLQWSKTFGGTGTDYGLSVYQTNDTGFIISGYTYSLGLNTNDLYLVRTTSDGSLLWSKNFGGTNTEYGYSIIETNDKGFIVTGLTGSFGSGNYDIYLLKTDSDGNSGCNEGNPNTIDTSPLITVTNSATQTSFGGIEANSPTQIGTDGAVITLCSTVGINDSKNSNLEITFFPNPFSSQITLWIDKFFKNASLTAYNSFGQTVKQIDNLSGQTIILHRDNLPSGLYFIRLTEENKTIAVGELVITDK